MDDYFKPERDELTDWQASVQREWERWEQAERKDDLAADWWPPEEDE
jgi:hypothetical protein